MEAKLKNMTIALVVMSIITVASLSFGIVATIKLNGDKVSAVGITVSEKNENVVEQPSAKILTVSPTPTLITTSNNLSSIIKKVEFDKDKNTGADSVKVTFEFTNNSTEEMNFLNGFSFGGWQNGVSLKPAEFEGNYCTDVNDVQPGVTVEVVRGYRLYDSENPIEFELTYGNGYYKNEGNVKYTVTFNK